MSFAKIVLMGNLGREPDLKYTNSGQPFCSFSMATTEKFMKDGERQERTLWAEITLWGKQAETASQYLQKGRSVYIEGRPRLEEWTDRDGNKRTSLKVNATDMQFVNDGGGQGQGGGNYQSSGGSQNRQQAQPRNISPKEQARQREKEAREAAAGGTTTAGSAGGLNMGDEEDDQPF